MRLSLIPRFAEILGLPARPAVQALRCRALTTGESICAVRRVRKRSVSLQKPPEASFQGCQEFIGLINVGGAATEESTAAAAAEQPPRKTVAIAADASTSTDFHYGQSGTGRLSFRLRRLQRNAKHPAFYDSLRSVKGKAVSRLGAFSGKIVGCLAFRWSLRRRNDNLPVPLCPLGKSVDSADHSVMATVFPGV